MISSGSLCSTAKKSRSSNLIATRERSNTAPKKKYPDTGKCLPIYTTQAPLEVISFFYRLGHEANDQKQSSVSSRSAFDSPLPEPLRKLFSSRLAEMVTTSLISLPVSPSYSEGEMKDYETVSNSSYFEDENKVLVSPPFFSEKTSDILLFEQCYSADIDMDSYEDSRYESSNIDFPINRSRTRAKSTDYAYSEANEASRAVVASIKTTKGLRKFLNEEQQGEKKVLFSAKDKLSKGRQNHILSKPILNIREKQYQRQEDTLAKINQRDDSVFNSQSLRPKAYSANPKHMGVSLTATSGRSESSLEEFKVDNFSLTALSGYI